MPSPRYRHAAHGGEACTLANDALRVDVFRRTTGWGWAEVSGPDGALLAVLDHLGEVSLRDSPVPVRLEAADVAETTGPDGSRRLEFEVRAVVVADALADTSFGTWIGSPFAGPAVTGTVTLTLDAQAARLRLNYCLESCSDLYVRYLRGPWLRVGDDVSGEGMGATDRVDALQPGTLGRYRMGVLDTCLPDTHNSTIGLYGGMAILPDTIAVNLLDLLADDRTTPVIVGDRPRVNWNGVSSR